MKNEKKLTKVLSFMLCLSILAGTGLLAGCGAPSHRDDAIFTPTTTPTTTDTPTTTTEDPGTTYTFDVGFSVVTDAVLVEQESQLNDFFALGNDGEFAIICNLEPISDYESIEEYARLTGEANNTTAQKDSNGCYFLDYINEEEGYHFYTAMRQGAENYYRVAFYCPLDNWVVYGNRFAQWADTVTVQ